MLIDLSIYINLQLSIIMNKLFIKAVNETDLCLFYLDEMSSSSLPENLQVPSAIADFVHQERVKGLSGPAVNR